MGRPADRQTSAADQAKAGLLADCSIEVIPRQREAVAALRSQLAGPTTIYIACPPEQDYEGVVAFAAALARTGFRPVPHMPVRALGDEAAFDELLRRLRGEAGVDRMLLLGGDRTEPAGPFASARDALATGLLSRHGFAAVGFATYPEPHPKLAASLLVDELRAKLVLAEEQGIEPWLVSQFAFDPQAVGDHARLLRREGVRAPLHVGVPGPASWRALARFALICGVSRSVQTLAQDPRRFGRLLVGFDPSWLLAELAHLAADPWLGLAQAHLFSFGGVERTAALAASLSVETRAAGRLHGARS